MLSRLRGCVSRAPRAALAFGAQVHQLFARPLPVRRFAVRGVAIACALLLQQVGSRNEAFGSAHGEPEVLDR